MGIVSSAFAGHCAELTAGPSKAYSRPLPGGSPIKMCRNARRKRKLCRAGSKHKDHCTAHHGDSAAAAVAAVCAQEDPVYSLIKGLQT